MAAILCRHFRLSPQFRPQFSRYHFHRFIMTSVNIKLPNGKEYSQPTGLFINNEFVKAKSGKTFDAINPAANKVICSVQEAGDEDVDIAVSAARTAFNGAWAELTPTERGKLLTKLAELIEEDAEALGAIESFNGGKPYLTAKNDDVGETANVIRYYGGWADKIHGKVIDAGSSRLTYTIHEPIGVCGQIIPWNFPLAMFSWKIAPALACGNTVVLKTAEQTPLSALYLCTLIQKAGFPPGAVNVISGFGKTTGAAIVRHPGVDKIAFTGSTAVGKEIVRSAGLKKVTLELGGKSPNIIFEDADIEQAVKWSHSGMFYNQGQVCSATTRIYVHESIKDKFTKAFVEFTQSNKVGNPFDEDTYQGPQISKAQFDRVSDYIKLGKKEGAKLLIGEEPISPENGFFIQPHIFADVKPDMRISREEIFGPVCVIMTFADEKEVIDAANDTDYGLAASIFTKDIERGHRVARKLQAGSVWINSSGDSIFQMPFGGYKNSGIGRELGEYGLQNYTQVKSVYVNLGNRL